MDYHAYFNDVSASLQRGGFSVQLDTPEVQKHEISLFADILKYPKQVHRGNDNTVSIGVRNSEKADVEALSTFVKAFHETIGSSLTSYLGFLDKYSNVNWKANLPVMVSHVSDPKAIEFCRSFKPDYSSKFRFVIDHPVLVNIETREIAHRETPVGRWGWGPWADLFNEMVSTHLVPRTM